MSWKNNLPKENRYFETESGILYKGNAEIILKNIKDNLIDVILTDPPYKYLDHKLDKNFNEDIIFNEWFRIIKKDSLISFFGRGKSFYRWNYFISQKLDFIEELIWNKTQLSNPCGKIGRIHETISIYRNGKKQLNKIFIDRIENLKAERNFEKAINDLKRIKSKIRKINSIEELKEFLKGEYKKDFKKNKHKITNTLNKSLDRAYKILKLYEKGEILKSIITISREHYKMEHPTQKPIKLIDNLVKLLSNENDLVLDPFLGSGTTAIVCEKLNRKWIGIEIDEGYCEIAKKRIIEENKQKTLF